MIFPPWALRILREAVLPVLVAWFSSYTYKHIVEPLDTPPVLTGSPVNVQTDIGGNLAPTQATTPNETPTPAPGPELPSGPVILPDQTRADIYPHTCKMPDGRSLNFRVVVFSEAYGWAYESVDKVQLNERILDGDDFVNRLRSSNFQEFLARTSELIAVGTASCEGSEWSREDDRALQRAQTLREWLERVRPLPAGTPHPPRNIHLLNLGRYRPASGQSCDPSRSGRSWNQRKVLLIAVAESSSGADLEECTRQSLDSDDQLRPFLKNYSRFDFNKNTEGGPL